MAVSQVNSQLDAIIAVEQMRARLRQLLNRKGTFS